MERRSGNDRRTSRRTDQGSVRTIVERMADGIVIVGVDGIIRFSNPAAQQLLGRSRAELEGTHLGYPIVAGDSSEIELVRPGGETVTVELRVVDLEWDGELAHLASLRDVTDRKRATERAEQLEEERLARAEADASNRAKSEFLAMMSHELRTPLNAVIGYAELLELGIPGALTDEQRTQIGRILTSARHLLGLVNEVLDLAGIDSGRLAVEHTVSPAALAIDGAVAVVQPTAEARGITIEIDATGDAGIAMYHGDEARVRQILVNLLMNAVKFTQPGGRVALRCGIAKQPASEARLSGVGPWVYVQVEDNGIGIPADRLAGIFDPFVQVDTTHTRAKEGSGLGLTVSRRLARLMNGDVSVQSEVGHGSIFTLWLPAVAPTHALAHPMTKPASAGTRLRGVAELGGVLLQDFDAIVTAFVERLRGERIIPSADSLRFSQLADHVPTYVADLAGVLIAAEEADGQPTSLVSGASEIQRLIAERHGARRASLGWSRETLSREWGILREEIERAVRRRASSIPEGGVSAGLALIERFIGQAEAMSARSLARAERAGDREKPAGDLPEIPFSR